MKKLMLLFLILTTFLSAQFLRISSFQHDNHSIYGDWKLYGKYWFKGLPRIDKELYFKHYDTWITKDGSSNLSFTDPITGTKTLAELALGGLSGDEYETIDSNWTFNDGIHFPDNAKATFGNTVANPDMSIYSDGTNLGIYEPEVNNNAGVLVDFIQIGSTKQIFLKGQRYWLGSWQDRRIAFWSGIDICSQDLGQDAYIYLRAFDGIDGDEKCSGGIAVHPSFDPYAVEFYTVTSNMIFGMADPDYKYIFNYDGIDSDLQIKTTGDENTFYVDAGNDRVGIGTDAPATTFDVDGESRASYFTSDVTTGTAPVQVTSTTLCTNFNANYLQGKVTGTSGNTIPLLDGANTWSGEQYFNENIGIGTATPESPLEIEAKNDAIGVQLLTLDQDDEDEAFIDYQGTSAADNSKNISTLTGAGAVSGPKRAAIGNAGWDFEGMVKIEINGTEYWMPYYSHEPALP